MELTKSNSTERREWPAITPNVEAQIAQAREAGIDARIVRVPLDGHYLLDPDRQIVVNEAIDEWAKVPGFADILLNQETMPAGAAWRALAKRAIALNAFYNTKTLEGPSGDIDPNCLDARLFVGDRSAREILIEREGEPAAAQSLAVYDQFFTAGSMRHEWDAKGISPFEYLAGSVDRIADVTRALAAGTMIREHEAGRRQKTDVGIVYASLGCGLAEPTAWLMQSLKEDGSHVDKLHLVDGDPIALAASTDRLRHYAIDGDTVDLHLENILKTPLTSYIEPASVDYVDLIGVEEYLPAKMASYLLTHIGSVVKPGGMIVFGNMLDERPQQEWFDGLWPKLQQRSIETTLKVIEDAGYPREWVKVRVPTEGVYALYSIEIPDSEMPPTLSEAQKKLVDTVLSRLPDY